MLQFYSEGRVWGLGQGQEGGTLTMVSQGSGKYPTPAAAVYPKGELEVPVRIPVEKVPVAKQNTDKTHT